LVETSTKFLEAWFVRRDFDEAAAYLSPRCADCVKLNQPVDEGDARTSEDPKSQLKKALRRVTETAGTATKLGDAIVAPQPSHADIQLVRHQNGNAFTIASIPDYMAKALECSSQRAGEPVSFHYPAGQKVYGKFYATGFRLAKTGEDSGVLWSVWAQEDGDWRLVAYTVLNP